MSYDSSSGYSPPPYYSNAPSLQPPSQQGPSNTQIFVTVLLVALAFTVGWLGNSVLNGVPPSARAYSGDIWKAWDTIDKHYVDQSVVDHQKMKDAMLSAMVASLGDTGHSRYLTAKDVAAENGQLSNAPVVGIGVIVQDVPVANSSTATAVTIFETLPDSPAQKAGLLPGDQIVAINGQNVTGQTSDMLTPLIKGADKTTVMITVLRPSTGLRIPVTITRAPVSAPIVVTDYFPDNHIGYVQITGVDTGATQQLTSNLKDLQSKGAKGIILDLRENGGGFVNEALGIAGDFLPNGATVVLEQDSNGKAPDKVDDSTTPAGAGAGLHLTLPMVVLVDGGTASAAEIITGALQDDRNITVIGTHTFGTNTVLESFPLSDGSEVLLGVKHFVTPNGRTFKYQVGLLPNTVVELPKGAIPLTPLVVQELKLTQADILAGKGPSNDTQLVAAIQNVQTQIGNR